jgi:hypothetical protein
VSILTTQKLSTLCKELAGVINQAHNSQDSLEPFYLRLSKAERRFYSVVTEYEVIKSSEIRFLASVGNISEVANRINRKLAESDDLRRLISAKKCIIDEHGHSGIEYFWSFASAGDVK